MKIALVGLRLTVGPRLILDTLGPALARQGHDVVFLGEDHRLPPPVRAVVTNDEASYPAMLRQVLSPRFHRAVADLLVSERPDCIYFLAVHPSNGPVCARLRRVRWGPGRPPVVAVHVHDPWPHPGPSWPLIFGAQQFMARAADRVVVYGEALARQVTRWYGVPRGRVTVVRHGASRPPRDTPPPSAAWTLFSFLGRIAGYKGLDVFLAAARRLHAARPGTRFYVGGAGPLGRYQAAIAALGGAITVVNRELSNEETDRAMQESWAVVLPYTSATQSGVIPVAYWNACPVVTTSAGALPESVVEGETGFVVAPGDAGALADRMAAVQATGVRAAMGAAAFAFYRRCFRWDEIAGTLVAALAPRGTDR